MKNQKRRPASRTVSGARHWDAFLSVLTLHSVWGRSLGST
nr:MAG TPA: hypothetical protein [Caudoviricetes sp.]